MAAITINEHYIERLGFDIGAYHFFTTKTCFEFVNAVAPSVASGVVC